MLKLGKSKATTYTQEQVEKLCAESFLDGFWAASSLHVSLSVDKAGNFAQTSKGELLLGKFAYSGQFVASHKYYPLQGITPVKR